VEWVPTSRNSYNMRLHRISGLPWLRLIQILCTLGLALVLWHSINWGLFAASLAGLHWGWLCLAALLLLIAHGFNVVRWQLLILPDRVNFASILSYYGAGIFSNNFLPTGIGGDGVRAALISRHTPMWRAIWSVAADRVIGLVGLVSIGVLGLWFGLPPFVADLARSLSTGWLVGITILGLVAVASLAVLWRLVPAVRAHTITAAQRLLPASEIWLRIMPICYLLSIASVLCLVLAHSCVLLALDLHISTGAAIWVVVIGSLSLLVPISVNGLGVMESVYVLVLSYYRVSAPDALIVALSIRVLMILFSLLGGLISLGQSWFVGMAAGR